MATTTLRAYLDELDQLLQQEALEEVVGHCRHILQHFPKNIETYRILGRALLDKRQFQESADIFQRVLSALPDDYTAHLGLSSASEEQGQLPMAVWHLERAFEQDPNNGTLQSELKRLYARRDGNAPDSIPMTRGTLARVYVKSRLYDQAIGELQTALKQMPDRLDLQLLLAQSLWNKQRKVEASDIALNVLDNLPNAIEGNRIMAMLWLESGRPSDAEPFVSMLEQLDPFVAWQVVHPDGKELPKNAFQLPHLDWNARTAAALVTDTPDWVSAIGNVFESPDSVSLSGGVNNWREDAVPAPANDTTQAPDWMKDFPLPSSTSMPAGDIPIPPAPTQDELPDWFKEATGAPPASTPGNIPSGEIEMPAWDDFTAQPESASPDPMSWLSTGPLPSLEEASTPDAGTPDPMSWLNTGPLPSLEDATSAPAEANVDPMSWLSTGPLPPLEENQPTSPTSAGADLSWLDMESPAESMDSAPSDAPAEPAGDLSWLEMEEPATPAPSAQAAQPAEDLSWLSMPSDDDFVASTEAVTGDVEDIDWGAALGGSTPATEPSASSQPAESAGDMDWLSSLPEPAASAQASGPATPNDIDWESALGGATPASEPSASSQSDESAGELDWLSSLPEPAASAPVTSPSASNDAEFGDMFSDTLGTDETSKGADELDWLADISPADAPPASPASLVDMPTGMTGLISGRRAGPELEPESSDELNLDWLGDEGTPANEFEAPAEEPAHTADVDWMSAMATLEAPAAEPAPAEHLDWLSSMAPKEETAAVESNLDWMSDEAESPAQPASTAPSGAESDFEWLSEEPTGMTGLFTGSLPGVPAAEQQTEEDWLSQLSTPAASTQDSETDTGWSEPTGLTGLFASEPPASERPRGTSTLPGTNIGWLDQEAASTEAAQASESNMGLDEDTMAWLRPYQDELSQPGSSAPTPEVPKAQAPVPAAPQDQGTLDWLSGTTESASTGDDWLASLGEVQSPAQPANAWAAPTESTSQPDVDNEWLAAFEPSGVPEAAEPQPVSGMEDEDWMSSIVSTHDSEAEPESVSDWMQDIKPAEEPPAEEAEEQPIMGTNWLARAATGQLRADPEAPAPIGETGILNPEQTPDWLSALSGEEDQPVSEGTPDWLSGDFAPAAEQTEPVQATEPQAATDFDFGSDFGAEEVAETAESADMPDWLSSMAPASASTQTAPTPLEDLDFGEPVEATDLDFSETADEAVTADWLTGEEEEPVAVAGAVAQPSNLVDTTLTAASPRAAGGIMGFKFDRPPVWLRRKQQTRQVSTVNSAEPAPAKPKEKLPDWLEQPVDFSGESEDDLPDWLRD